MSSNYITTVTEEWLSDVFLNMTDLELFNELSAMRNARDFYLCGDGDPINSFVFEFIDNVYDIARDSLVTRFIHSHAPFDLEDDEKDNG